MRSPLVLVALVLAAVAASGCTTQIHYCSISQQESPHLGGTVVSSYEEEARTVTEVNGSYHAESSSGGGKIHGTYESHSEEHSVSSGHRVDTSYGPGSSVKTVVRGACQSDVVPSMPTLPTLPEIPEIPRPHSDSSNQTV